MPRSSNVPGRLRSLVSGRRVAAAVAAGVVGSVLLIGAAPVAVADTFSSPDTGTHSVAGAILDEYRHLKGPQGRLGYPVTDELPTPQRFGRFNHFQHGSIYWSPATGAHEIRGGIRHHWAEIGWENSTLGFPTTDEFAIPGGVTQHFERGSMYWSAATGAHLVRGAIHERWAAMGWGSSYLGFPVTDEIALRRGAYQLFQGGAVYWSPTTGAHAVRGYIAARWAETGWENGPLGYPVSSENALPGGASSHFQGGTISWSADTGAHVVVGAVRDLWARMGWEGSLLGHPVTDEYSVPGGRQSDFEYGSITWTPLLGAAPEILIEGSGTEFVPLVLGESPMIADVVSGPTSARFTVLATTGSSFAMPLVDAAGSYSGTGVLNLARPRHPFTGLQVTTDTDWVVHVMPLIAAPAFAEGEVVSGGEDSVLHYVGRPGTVRITGDGSSSFGVFAYDNRGEYLGALVANGAPAQLTAPLPPDVYLHVVGDGPEWSIEAL